MVAVNVLPFILLIVVVLGSIIIGATSPTEAASIGAAGAIVLAFAYRGLTWEKIKHSVYETMVVSSFVLLITVAANIFGGVFLALKGGELITRFLFSLPIGPYGILIVILVCIFIMGFS